MSQLDELGLQYQRLADAAAAKTVGRQSFDWAILVVALALGSTLAWTYFLFRTVVCALQFALS
jgi:hypothetical protein